MGRLIDADALIKAVDKEREYLLARGQKGAEHILVHNFRDLIDNAPTVEPETTRLHLIDDIRQKQISADKAWLDGYEKAKRERPHSKRAERALSIIDRLRTDGHINNKEQGTLRRAILLPERTHERGAE